MNEITELVDAYLAVWNETDPAARGAALAEVFTENGSYIDPLAEAHDRAMIAATIGAVQEQFPGLTFRRSGEVDTHHDQVRFRWAAGPGEEELVVGFDVAVLADGKINAVYGFLDKVPAGLLPAAA